ncbi:MAG: hypothetical protein ABIQ95_08530 [Bdellovibrionia bacterium]
MARNLLFRTLGFTIFASIGLQVLGSPRINAETSNAKEAIEHGKKVWFENTYGGEKFFHFLANHPDASKRITVGFENVVNTPRNQRFERWGAINDPDCHVNPSGGPDLCTDPSASGIVGIRKALSSTGKPIYGISCASCHAGFDPLNPPSNLNEPTWSNIHPTIGNQYLESGKVFAANLPATDPRKIMFSSWPKGTADTTAIFNDHIMNPGVVTAFWNITDRPTFDVGLSEKKIRAGQGGEDDLGGDIAALRVYTNIGVCFSECVASNINQPINIRQCKKTCPDFPPQKDLDDLVTFLQSIRAPKLPTTYFSDTFRFQRGKKIFESNCASCHSKDSSQKHVLSNDEVNPLNLDPAQATNKCRALSTNWEEGHIWAEFSSSNYKKRVPEGLKGYRTMPLSGIWATTPFLHNQSVGEWAAPNASPSERAKSFERSMYELLNANRAPKISVSPVAIGPFPAGTPLHEIFSRDATTGKLLCDDIIENRGHTYGSDLSDRDKKALIYWLKSQ